MQADFDVIGQRDATYTVSISSFLIPAFRPTPALVLHVTKAGVEGLGMRSGKGATLTRKRCEGEGKEEQHRQGRGMK